MTRIFFLSILLFPLFSFSQSTYKIIEEVENTNGKFESAIARHDTKELNSLINETAGLNKPNGIANGRNAIIQQLINEDYTSFKTTNNNTFYYGETVVIMGLEKFLNSNSIGITRNYTNVWLHHENRWELIARHVN